MSRPHSFLAPLLFASMTALAALSTAACGGGVTSDAVETSDDALRESALPTGTYVIDGKPSASMYLARLTILAGSKYEADLVVNGTARFSRGKYTLFAARPNNPDSPVAQDKPWMALAPVSGPGPNFEFDRLPDGGLKMYTSARQQSFSMKKDPNWKPAATTTKTISCTSAKASAKLVLDAAKNQAGTLTIKAKAGERTPSATVPVLLVPASETGTRDWVHYEGSNGDQDFFFGMVKADFDRGSGAVHANVQWAEGGQQFSIPFDRCSF